jgi:tRNA modification GTPase
MHSTDTIAAIATAAGAGGIGVVRVSGAGARAIAAALGGTVPAPRYARYTVFRDAAGASIDDGLVLYFPAPHSYTGEDVVELQAHGSPILLDQLLRRCFELGARAARPGEFTERAWLNRKLDLAQAEAVADLIAAGSEAAARAARRSLDGVFSARIESLLAALTALRVHIEAAIDFPEEEIDFLADADLQRRLDGVLSGHADLLAEAARGQRLRDGLHVAIIGAPNVGKSSLLNALAGADRAIVTAVPGTTRDLLREDIRIDGIEMTLVDTAGLRDSDDDIEREGMRRGRAEVMRADLVLAVVDARELESGQVQLAAEVSGHPHVLWLYNKMDLLDPDVLTEDRPDRLWISARDGLYLDRLRSRLREEAGVGDADGAFSARARHVEALRRVGQHLAAAAWHLRNTRAGELAAEELRLAQHALGEITGTTTSDDLLGAIFSSFCIGK